MGDRGRRYRYVICDVFTRTRFGGNPLAVLPEADGLDAERMQRIAREFNISETAFCFPGDGGHDRRLRIFTPTKEVPFAGHPNIGTAFVLAGSIFKDKRQLRFAEAAGTVAIDVRREPEGAIFCELLSPRGLELGPVIETGHAARALSLEEQDIVTSTHPPRVASVGLPFVFVEVRNREALARARPDLEALDRLRAEGIVPDVHLYTRSDDDFDLRSRMFAPFDGVLEDPATGSANCALAALLAAGGAAAGEMAWRIAQGVEMGRPSELSARASRAEDGRIDAWIGGYSVRVAEGEMLVD